MKIMIAYPPLHGPGGPMLTQNRQFQWMSVGSYIYPLVPAYAATILKQAGHDVSWRDAITEHLTAQSFFAAVERERPDLIAIETKTPVVRQTWKVAEVLKAVHPEGRVVMMGDHVTALPMETLQRSPVDFAITGGDYDFSLLRLANALEGRGEYPAGLWYRDGESIRNTGPFKLSDNLSVLPFIDRRLTKAHLYYEKWKKREPFFYTMIGRDCQWGKCTFCSWTTTYDNFRTQPPKKLLDEIEYLVEEFGAREVFDDTGNFPAGGWLRQFCNGMIERGLNKEILFTANMKFDLLVKDPKVIPLMKQAGFRKVKSGLESANQITLDRLDKNVKVEQIVEGCRLASEAGLDVHLTIMVGYPWETREDAQRTIDLARSLMDRGYAEMLQCTVLMPYPGTPLYADGLRERWFRFDPTDYDRFGMTEPVFITPDMEPDDVMRLSSQIYRSFMKPRYILRHLSRMRRLEDLRYVLRGVQAVAGHLADFAGVRTQPTN